MNVLRFLVFILLSIIPSFAHAQKRVALVIGNSAYKYAGTLTNPTNDATDMAAALRKFGFQVVDGFDLDKVSFDRKVREFGTALANADAGVFFYAGHGLQAGGQNYLVPVDAKAETADALDFEMVRLDLVQRTMERTVPTNILFLDACRNNPLARNLARAMGTRSAEIGRGLAAVESGVGTLISFSTQPGNVALDGAGRNSPFAGALIRHLANSSDSLSDLLIAVRNDVRKETENKQVPWEHTALTGRFYFGGTPPVQGAPASQTDKSELERAWSFIKETDDAARLEAFIRQFGDSAYAPMARARLEELRKKQVVIVPPSSSSPTQSDATIRSRSPTSEFDGNWRVVTIDGEYCRTPGQSYVRQWTITNGVVIAPNGDRGTVSIAGEVRLRRYADNPPRVIFIRVQLNGSQGRGTFHIEGIRCGGTMSLTRM